MGLTGDQVVKPENQNGKIAYSKDNGYRLFYFVAVDKNKYKYIGEAKLAKDYYFEMEKDSEGNLRKVAKFPLYII
jgi:5-methylcytosine-specific restriction protein A